MFSSFGCQVTLVVSRQQVLQPKVIDPNEVVTDMEMMLRRVIGEHYGLETELNVELGAVKADPGQMQQVLLNLVVNARDAMTGGGMVRIRTADVEIDEGFAAGHPGIPPGAYVELAVSDTGTGIDDETKARLFEPFFTTKEQGKGTGLGLSISYKIIQRYGGLILVESEVGVGTKFSIRLPVSS